MSAHTPRVRFAPSPTGFLHVGGARTALFNWLYARNTQGVMILRIEDTDIARSSEEMVTAILDGLSWMGITHDEGPFFQSTYRAEHVAKARIIEQADKAYRCFCSPEALEERKRAAEARNVAWKYDRACERLPRLVADRRRESGEPSCLRFRVPEGVTAYTDLVHGSTSFDNAEIEDLIILRTDGTPTYNLSCVSDDIDMRVTHVIRGDDHISNTPKQILLYEALGARPPLFGHLPLILGDDKKRLSKRHGAVSVMEYKRAGYLPETLFNFLALLGWSPGNDREILTKMEMIEAFAFSGVGNKSAVFDHDKLTWMNAEYLKQKTGEELFGLVRDAFAEAGLWQAEFDRTRHSWFVGLLDLLKDRCRLITEFARDARPFLTETFEYDPASVAKHFSDAKTADRLRALAEELARVEPFDESTCETSLRGLATRLGAKAGELIHPARVALTGRMVSPGIFAVMTRMGRDGVVSRLNRAVRYLGEQKP